MQRPQALVRITNAILVALLLTCGSAILTVHAKSTFTTEPVLRPCKFEPSDQGWKGPCEGMGGENPVMEIYPEKSITTGVWRTDIKPSSVWGGKLTYRDDVQKVEIEIYGDTGVLRTPDQWYPLSKAALSTYAFAFQVDTSNEVPPNELDHQIVERAAKILSSESVWNRADNRKCAATDTKWSIYCAMQKATVEVTGGFHHRRPALEFVRKIVEKRSEGRPYKHRLMDYNNDPSTRLDDVRTLFAEALTQMSRS